MKKRTLILGGLMLFAITAFLWGATAGSAAAEKIVLKFGHVLQMDHPYHKMAVKFKSELERRNKNVAVNIFPAKQLGNERDLVEGLQIGSVDISTITSALTAGFVPGFKAFSLPFLFTDADHLFRVMDSAVGEKLVGDMETLRLHYAQEIDLFEKYGSNDFQDAILSETDPQIIIILDKVVTYEGEQFTVRDAILQQTNPHYIT